MGKAARAKRERRARNLELDGLEQRLVAALPYDHDACLHIVDCERCGTRQANWHHPGQDVIPFLVLLRDVADDWLVGCLLCGHASGAYA